MVKPLIVDLPYPEINAVTPSKKSAMIIAPAYSGLSGEITAILGYTYHSFYFNEYCEEIALVLEGIAIAEMKHFDMLGRLMLKLGVSPIISQTPPYQYDFYNTSRVSYSKTPHKMLLDDITGEMKAIMEYKKMLEMLDDEYVSAIISRIILDEELHVKILKTQLEKLNNA